MGICFLSNVPGLVPDKPLHPALARMGLSKRSMVAAEIEPSLASVPVSPQDRRVVLVSPCQITLVVSVTFNLRQRSSLATTFGNFYLESIRTLHTTALQRPVSFI